MQRRWIYKMFYKQFLKITDIFSSEIVEEFDYWLATLPSNRRKHITISTVSATLGISYTIAEKLLQYAEEQNIVEIHFIVKCPDCESVLEVCQKEELADILVSSIFCFECDEEKTISVENIYSSYELKLIPDISEKEIEKAIEKRIAKNESTESNFSEADSLIHHKEIVYEAFYNPSESAYKKFNELRSKVKLDYGKNTTKKGRTLEVLILEIFKQIKGIRVTNDIKTETNQFDCTCLVHKTTTFESVFNYLSPYFIIECKNETKKPNNTYCNKLLSIMSTNEAQVGIIVGRKDATEPCFKIAREHYLTTRGLNQKQIVLTMSDDDLKLIIDQKVNLLEYLDFKIFQVTANAPNSKFTMFKKNENDLENHK